MKFTKVKVDALRDVFFKFFKTIKTTIAKLLH